MRATPPLKRHAKSHSATHANWLMTMNRVARDNETRRTGSQWGLYACVACALIACAFGAQGEDASVGAPTLYVVDAANTLQSFDANGAALGKFKFNPEVGALAGGMTLSHGDVYAISTKGKGTEAVSRVFAFDAATLKQVRLHIGAFAPPADGPAAGKYSAIVYDPDTDRFFVASERLSVLVFDRLGTYIPRKDVNPVSVTALAYDANQHVLWGIVDRHVVKFAADGSGPLPGVAASGAQYRHHGGALAIAYCAAQEGSGSPGSIAVTFSSGAVGNYDAAGRPSGALYRAKLINARAMSCSSHGEVFIAADNGLKEYVIQGAERDVSKIPQALTAPIYGVLAAP
jgi:hypothetical protein